MVSLMKVLNIMLSRSLGGIQQAFMDYENALNLQGVEIINVTSIFAKINTSLSHSVNYKLANLGPWDIFSIVYLKKIIKATKPDFIIAHGNRAINFTRNFCFNSKIPLIGIAHNYTLKGLKKCDYIIALTSHMRSYLLDNNFKDYQIFIVPNMIDIKKDFNISKKYRKPIVIGSLARFVPKKGINILLQSLAILRDQKYDFKAIIGGDGEDKEKLLMLCRNLALENYVSFIGWVKDKDKFFNDIDIFCLPSLHEPFGIILLEAMEASIPIVSTKSEGPNEILRDKQDALLVDLGSAEDLAKHITLMIDNEAKARQFTHNSYLRLQECYNSDIIGAVLLSVMMQR